MNAYAFVTYAFIYNKYVCLCCSFIHMNEYVTMLLLFFHSYLMTHEYVCLYYLYIHTSWIHMPLLFIHSHIMNICMLLLYIHSYVMNVYAFVIYSLHYMMAVIWVPCNRIIWHQHLLSLRRINFESQYEFTIKKPSYQVLLNCIQYIEY